MSGAADQITVGGGINGNLHRELGLAVAQIFIPVEQGDAQGWRLAEAVGRVFRAVTVDGIKFKSPSIQMIGRDGGWWQFNVACPFDFDRIA